MLEAGKSQSEVTAYLEKEMRDHFGLDPVPGDADACAVEAITWYQRAWPGSRA
jgi:hypothetical protein